MTWNGYLEYDGVEIVNAPRTLAYARTAGITWVEDEYDSDVLHEMLGHEPYEYIDAGTLAPWYDPGDPDSLEFLGALPLSFGAIDDTKRTAEVFEFTTDGGGAGRVKSTTKDIVFSFTLAALSEAGAEFGKRWLAKVTSEKDCSGRVPEGYGAELQFAKSEPMWDPGSGIDPVECFNTSLRRRVLKTRFLDGPVVTGARAMTDGSEIWMVSLNAVAGDAYQYGMPVQVLDSLGAGADPYAPGFTGAFDNVGFEYVEGPCSEAVYAPLYDPLMPALVAPPGPPDIPVLAVPLPTTWTRRYAEIPASVISKWDEMRIVLATGTPADIRNVRFRIYETEDFTPDVNCGHIGVFLETYIPGNSTFYADGVQKAAYVDQGTVTRRADSLIFGQWVRPVEWFSLSCRKSYTVAMDIPPGSPAATAGLYLTGRSL